MTHQQLTKSWNVRSLKDKVRTFSRITTLGLHSLEYTLLKTFEKSLPQANYHHAGEGLGKRKKRALQKLQRARKYSREECC